MSTCNLAGGRQWVLLLAVGSLLLSLVGCSHTLTLQVRNDYAFPIQVYQTFVDTAGKRQTVLIGRLEPHQSGKFPGALKPGEKIYHLKFRDTHDRLLGDVVTTGASLEKKLDWRGTWTVSASPGSAPATVR